MQGIYQDKCFQVNLKGSLFTCSFARCFPFCNKQGAAIFNRLGIQIKQQDKQKNEFCLPYNQIGEVISFLFCSKSFKTWFFKKVKLPALSSANWIFTRKHVHFTMLSQEVHLFWVCLSIWLDNFCVYFVLKYLIIDNQGNNLRYFNYLSLAFLKITI